MSVLCLLAAAGLAAGTPAGDAATLVVDAPTAVAQALGEHPSVRLQRERNVELAGQVREARSRALPSVEATASAVRARDPALLNSPQFSDLGAEVDRDATSDPILDRLQDLFRFDPTPLTLTTYDYGVSVEQPIYSFGKIETGIEAAETLREQYDHELRDAELSAAREAVTALYGLALAERRLDVLAAERRSREQQVTRAEDFLEIGTGTRLQLLQARAALAGLVPREIAAEGDVARSRATLNEALGRAPLAPVRAAPGVLAEAELEDLPELDRLLALAHRRPELRALRVERKALGLERRARRAQLYPELDFVGRYGIRTIFSEELFNTDFQAWDAGLYLTWNLFDGFASQAASAQIASRKRQNEITEALREGEITRDLVAATAEYRRAREASHAAREAVAQAEEALRVAQEEAQWGAATELEVLEAQRTATDARFQRLQAVHDALVALAEVHQLVGRLPTESIEETP